MFNSLTFSAISKRITDPEIFRLEEKIFKFIAKKRALFLQLRIILHFNTFKASFKWDVQYHKAELGISGMILTSFISLMRAIIFSTILLFGLHLLL